MKVHGELEVAGYERVSSNPVSNLFTGRTVFNTSNNTAYIYYGGTWNALGTGGGGGGGDVTGPGSSTDNALVRFDGATGKVIQNSSVIVDDSANITGVNDLTVGNNLTISGWIEEPIHVGDYGLESSGVNVNGVTYNAAIKINDIGGSQPAQFVIHKHSTTLPAILFGTRANSNTSSHAAVTNSMNLFELLSGGWTGSHYDLFAGIYFNADATGTISATSSPGTIDFLTTPDGGNVPQSAMTIRSDKTVEFKSTTATTVPYLDANKKLVSSAVTPTELGYLTGATSSIQTQIDAKLTNPLTTRGDLLTRDVSTEVRLPVGTSGQYLSSDGTDPSWSTFDLVNANINASAAIDVSKLAALTINRAVVSDGSGFISASAVTATELAYLTGATSNIQTQLTALENGTGTFSISEWTIETAAMTDWDNATGLTLSTGTLKWRREGDSLRVQGFYQFTGSGTDTGTFAFNFGSILSSLTMTANTMQFANAASAFSNGNNSGYPLSTYILYASELVEFFKDGGIILKGTDISGTTSGEISRIGFDILVPITGWAAAESLDPLTTNGDIVIYNSGVTRLPVGTVGQVLTVSGGLPSWQNSAAGFTDPMTTRGDLIFKNAAGTTTRLPTGTSGQYLGSDGTDTAWTSFDLVNANINASAAIAYSKLAALTINRALVSDGSGVVSVSAVTATELGYLSGATSSIQTQLGTKVTGPASATDNAITRYDGTTGKLVQNSGATIDDSGNLTAVNITATGQIASNINDVGNSGTTKTIDWNDANVQFVDMTGNCTFTFSNPVSGGTYQLILKQDGTGSRTATWPATVLWPGGTAPTLSTAASSIDIVTFTYSALDTEYYGVSQLDFS